jgi:hypothetical protein
MQFVFDVYLYSRYEAQDDDDNVAKRQEWITKSRAISAHVQSRNAATCSAKRSAHR